MSLSMWMTVAGKRGCEGVDEGEVGAGRGCACAWMLAWPVIALAAWLRSFSQRLSCDCAGYVDISPDLAHFQQLLSLSLEHNMLQTLHGLQLPVCAQILARREGEANRTDIFACLNLQSRAHYGLAQRFATS